MRVSFESLYGTCTAELRAPPPPSVSADTTLASVERERLICEPSTRVWPAAPVLSWRSLQGGYGMLHAV